MIKKLNLKNVSFGPLKTTKIYLFWWVREIPEGIPLSALRECSSVLRWPLFGYALISPLAILGLALSYQRKKGDLLILYFFLSSFLLSGMIYFVNERYRMAAMPVLLLFASFAIFVCYEKFTKKKYLYSFSIIIGAILLFLILNINFAAAREDVVYNQLGVSYAKEGKTVEAEKYFKKALDINPSHPMAHYNLGTLYLHQKRYNEAIKELEEAIRLNPDYADAHNNLGTIYNISGQREKAIYHFESSLKINAYQENIKRALEDLRRK